MTAEEVGTEPAARHDAGMTLIEVVVAFGIFLVVAGAVLSLLGGAIRLAKEDRYRMVATSLATRELEVTRDAFSSLTRGPTTITTNQVVNPNQLPGGTANRPLVVDNVEYTVTRTAQWAQVGSTAASTCDDGSNAELAFLRVRVEVTWPGLGDRPPVSTDTIMTPPKGTYSQSTGHIGVRLLDAEGEPLVGKSVSVSGPNGTSSGVTASDGCAVFAFLPEGSYAITANLPGHINRDGTPSKTVQVQSGQLVRTVLEYALASRLVVTYRTTAGYEPKAATGFPVTLANSGLLPTGTTVRRGAVDAASPTQTLDNLWPYPAGYEVWAGACTDSDPYQNDQARELVEAAPGVTSNVTLPLAAVQVTLSGSGNSNKEVTATRLDDATCPGGASIVLGSTDSSGVLKTSLPYGKWKLAANGRSNERTFTWTGSYPDPVTLS
jgi:type II secretory pathway pseudopilin PulG